jgi:hypothetical protein
VKSTDSRILSLHIKMMMPTMLSVRPCLLVIVVFFIAIERSTVARSDETTPVPQVVPAYKKTQVLVAAATQGEWPYLAFPAIVDLGDDVLVSYKRGKSHAYDVGAGLDLIRLNAATQTIGSPKSLVQVDSQIMQMGEWVRFANGDVACYIDVQGKGPPTERLGLMGLRSRDGGKTFGPLERVGVINGVEYGYPFEALTEGSSTWMLVMTFANLPGGKSVYKGRPAAGAVDVIRSNDNGQSWRLAGNITRELGNAPINESSFIRHGKGFLVTARGYDNRQWLAEFDGDFKLQRKIDLTAQYSFITSYIGRPRLFARDGNVYLLGRNFCEAVPSVTAPTPEPLTGGSKKHPMRLSLFRIEPASLAITKHVLLDNAEGESVSDGYYAMPYWRERDGRTQVSVITYKRAGGRGPDILRLEYDWAELR